MRNELTYMDCWHFIAPLIPVNTDYTMDIYIEEIMKKNKEPDYLTLCSIAAQEAGMSYGKYMAMHGYHPPIQADVEDVEAPQGISKICPQCGKEFTQGKIKQKIYCSFECQKAHAQRAAQRRYRDRKNKELEVHE